MKSSRFPRQPVHGQRDGIMDFRLPLPVSEVTDIDGNPFFYPFVAEAPADERRLDGRAYRPARIVRQGIYDARCKVNLQILPEPVWPRC